MSNSFTRTADAVTAIYALESMDELRDIYDAIRNKEKQLSRSNIRQITNGDVVSFTARNGTRVVGVVAKKNRKTVEVRVGELASMFNTTYRVPASMLTVEEAA